MNLGLLAEGWKKRMPTDMRPFAERLAQAMPGRFKLKSNLLRDADNMPPGTHWTDFSAYVCELRMDLADVSRWWAFWGPLLEELRKKGSHLVLRTNSHGTVLEAIADAVCQEAERSAKDK